MYLLIVSGVVAKYVYYEDGEEPGVKDVQQSGAYISYNRWANLTFSRNAGRASERRIR